MRRIDILMAPSVRPGDLLGFEVVGCEEFTQCDAMSRLDTLFKQAQSQYTVGTATEA